MSYGDLMRKYARQRRLRRLMIPVPLLTPRLSSLWLGLVTPVYARIGRKLIDSIRHPTVVRDQATRQTFPHIRPQEVREAITSALGNEDRECAATHWADALSSSGAAPRLGRRALWQRLWRNVAHEAVVAKVCEGKVTVRRILYDGRKSTKRPSRLCGGTLRGNALMRSPTLPTSNSWAAVASMVPFTAPGDHQPSWRNAAQSAPSRVVVQRVKP